MGLKSRPLIFWFLFFSLIIGGCIQGPQGPDMRQDQRYEKGPEEFGGPGGPGPVPDDYGFIEPKTCPDKIVFENDRMMAFVGGVKKYITREDGEWIRLNCDQSATGMKEGPDNQQNGPGDENNFTYGYELFPKGMCPETIVMENNLLLGIINGTTRFIKGEDVEWIRRNCDPKLWDIFQDDPKNQDVSGLPVSGSATDWLPECGANNAFFSVAPVDLSVVTGIVPLGNFNPSGHTFPTDHVYFYLKKSISGNYNSAPVETTLYSPGNAWIVAISGLEHVSENPPYTDYDLDIMPCKDVTLRFAHVTTISQELRDLVVAPYGEFNEYTTGGKAFKMYKKILNVSISAGEVIGTAGGREGQNALDVGTYDARSALSFARPERWENSRAKYTTCPVDYFEDDINSKMVAKLGNYQGTISRTVEPLCGEFAQDVPDTAQGVWLVNGTTNIYPEDPHLTLGHDNVEPQKGVFSVGTSIKGLQAGAYPFVPKSSGLVNRDFKDVKADGKVYCYEPQYFGGSSRFTIILQLTSDTTLQIEKREESASCGGGPWVFGTGYTDFER